MAATTKTWVNNQPPSAEDSDLNGFKNENNNLILASGQSLNTGDLQQTNKAVAHYAVVGNLYVDTGIANAYVLSAGGSRIDIPDYEDGMEFEFIPTNDNTGASTVDIGGGGVKNIIDTSNGGELIVGARYIIRYRLSSDDFEIVQNTVFAGSIFGLTLSNAADADHDITIDVGSALDSSNAFILKLLSSITKQIDAIWAAGDAAGGLFSGAVAVDTWYHLFLIRKDSDGSIDAGFDTSVTAANIPGGYTAFRRLGSVLTDGAANILPFIQNGNRFMFETPLQDYAATLPTVSRSTVTLSTPLGLKTRAILRHEVFSAASSTRYMRISDLAGADLVASTPNHTALSVSPSASFFNGNFVEIYTNVSSQVGVRGSNAVTGNIQTHGWEDNRGQY